MTVTLLRVGETKSKFIAAQAALYEARLAPFCRVEEKIIRPAPLPDEASDAEIALALQKEADAILAFCDKKPRALVFALCVEGQELSSEAFSELLTQKMQLASEFVFLIGSSHGLSPAVKARADTRLSLSRMTLPHELARLFLSEQLYRAFQIQKGAKYHK